MKFYSMPRRINGDKNRFLAKKKFLNWTYQLIKRFTKRSEDFFLALHFRREWQIIFF